MGPFCRRDNYSWVRGVLERLMTHLSMWLVHVWLETDCLGAGWLAAGWKSAAWVEGMGAMGVAGNAGSGGMIGCSGRKVGWHI